MKKFKKFLAGTFLSGMCLVSSAPVLAAGGPKNTQVTVRGITSGLNFIEKKILFETTDQLLNNLNLLLTILKGIAKNLDFAQKHLLSGQFEKVLQQLKTSRKILSVEEQEVYEGLMRDIMSINVPGTPENLSPTHTGESLLPEIQFKTPPAPRITPKIFPGEISELVWLTSIGTENKRELTF